MVDENKDKNIDDLPKAEKPEGAELHEPAFKPPEQVAEHDNSEEAKMVVGHHGPNFNSPKKSKRHSLMTRWHNLSKKQKILAGILAAIILASIAAGIVFALSGHKPKPMPNTLKKPTITVKPAPKPTTVPSTLTGLPVAPSVNQQQVTGVMIENSVPARPQSGLEHAGVVFEAIAEGGITRFLALYQGNQANWIGPVRSARPYYVEWCMGFDCDYAHVGGSYEALYDIKAWHVKDLNQFYYPSYYQRITARYAPHNVYTSTAQLNALEKANSYKPPNYTGFPRKPDSPSKNPNARHITFNISWSEYQDLWVYNPKANNYVRYEAGAPHTELTKSGKTVLITPKVVIGIVMDYSLESDNYHSHYNVVGTGKAYIFQDGTVTTGTWIKTSKESQIRFMDANGKNIKLNAGQTWITALSSSSEITYN